MLCINLYLLYPKKKTNYHLFQFTCSVPSILLNNKIPGIKFEKEDLVFFYLINDNPMDVEEVCLGSWYLEQISWIYECVCVVRVSILSYLYQLSVPLRPCDHNLVFQLRSPDPNPLHTGTPIYRPFRS